MTADEQWKAVRTNDARYDGRFYYAVKSTGVFCRPSCASRLPKKENVRYFGSAQEAIDEGFRPCKRCRPDLSQYEPIRDIAHRAKALLDTEFSQQSALRDALHRLGISPHRLAEVFRTVLGMTPLQYTNRLRVDEAKRLLAETDADVLTVAHLAGFASVSTFYRVFKQQTGTSPAKYRAEKRQENTNG